MYSPLIPSIPLRPSCYLGLVDVSLGSLFLVVLASGRSRVRAQPRPRIGTGTYARNGDNKYSDRH